MRTPLITCSLMGLFSLSAVAESGNWVDKQHHKIKSTLHSWSNKIDSWIDDPDPNKPATANLRIMFDNEWNHYDGYSIKPRVRAKIKLPALKRKFSVVIGDEDLDNQSRDKNQLHRNYRDPLKDDKKYDRKQSKNDNASLALRWSEAIETLGIDADLDLGIRSGADIFVRVKTTKLWQISEQYSVHFEQIYRYGLNSKHYLRTNFENRFAETETRSLNNHTYLQYTHDIDEKLLWGNSSYRQHNYANFKQLNYGISIGGDIKHEQPKLNSYGPFINWRQPILREWLFIQPELNYYNNKSQARKHTLGAFLRVEAIF